LLAVALAVIAAVIISQVMARPARLKVASPRPSVQVPTSGPDRGSLTGFEHYAATVRVPRIIVRDLPDPSAPARVELGDHNENGVPQVFLVKGEQQAADGTTWYRVALPIRPNGTTGWVAASDVDVTGIDYRLIIHLSAFHMDLLEKNQLRQTIPIGIGTDQTPTPGGEYYIKELLKPPNPNTVYGDYVFGLSGFSNVLTSWPQGGVLGIHGTNDPAHSIGRKISHGCIRTSNGDIDFLANILPLGTPIEVES
jgi:hypothetical protein